MNSETTVVYGFYHNRVTVEKAVETVRNLGFRMSDVSVLLPEKHMSPDLKTAAGAGGALSGAFGWLVGAGMLVLSGLAPLLAAGPLVALLSGAGVGGAFTSIGIPEYEAQRLEDKVHAGSVLLSVHTYDAHWMRKAHELLVHTGAHDIGSTSDALVSLPAAAEIPLFRG